jgi:hypothetical protein
MSKFEVYEGSKKNVRRLRLIKNEGTGRVDLCIVDEDGEPYEDGRILGVDERGIERYSGFSSLWDIAMGMCGTVRFTN